MSKRNDTFFLLNIAEALDRVAEFTATGEEDFLKDAKTQAAVERVFEIAGEATKNLSDEFRRKYPDIPWKNIAGFRDMLSHQYFGIDLKIVWEISQTTAVAVKKQIELMPEYREAMSKRNNESEDISE